MSCLQGLAKIRTGYVSVIENMPFVIRLVLSDKSGVGSVLRLVRSGHGGEIHDRLPDTTAAYCLVRAEMFSVLMCVVVGSPAPARGQEPRGRRQVPEPGVVF